VDDYDSQPIDRLPVPAGAAGEIMRQELNQQIQTAKAYPRRIQECRAEALELCTMTEEIAKECIYALQRQGKDRDGVKKAIEGPSVRMAEILVYCWGNMRVGSRVIDMGPEFITAQGFCLDLQRNNGVSVELKRRIVSAEGRRYSADMIGVTANAACSLALRNAVFDTIPKPFWADIYQAAKRVAIGNVRTLSSRVDAALSHFAKMGVDEPAVLRAIGIASRRDMTVDHIATLTGFDQAIRDRHQTIEQVFDLSPPKISGASDGAAKSAGVGVESGHSDPTNNNAQPPAADPGGEGKASAAKDNDGGPTQTPAGDESAVRDPVTDPPGADRAGPSDESDREDEILIGAIEAAVRAAQTPEAKAAVIDKHIGAIRRIRETSTWSSLSLRAKRLLTAYKVPGQ
jgi:hypothetical protein